LIRYPVLDLRSKFQFIFRRIFAAVKGVAMVIPEARYRLQEALADLSAGRITNWQFDRFYFELNDPADRAVAELANFGCGLYHDGIGPYRITEHYVIKPETREIAGRCLLFLETEMEYEWPDAPSQTWRNLAGGIAIFRILPSCIVASLGTLLLFFFALEDRRVFIYFLLCGLVALLLLASCILLWRYPAIRRFGLFFDEVSLSKH
jgi:hypothetical protein